VIRAVTGREWGADRHGDPMPAVPRPVSDRVVGLGRLAVALGALAWLAFIVTTATHFSRYSKSAGSIVQTVAFAALVTLLALSALAYMMARLGFYYRIRIHRRAARATLDEFFATRQPTLTAIVPSYQEDARVIRMTLLSAALQAYPDIRVVLLIDDPPEPRYAAPYRLLAAARALPGEIEAMLAAPSARFKVPFVDLGLVPEAGSSVLLPRRIGRARAGAALYLGETIAAEQAYADGIVTRLIADDALDAEAEAAALAIAAKPRAAVRETKRLVNYDREAILAAMAREGTAFRARLASDEARAAMSAFFQRGARG